MDNVVLVNTGSEGTIPTNGNDIVVKLVDEKNALVAEYVFYIELLKYIRILYYKADNSHIHFHADIMPCETKEIVCVN